MFRGKLEAPSFGPGDESLEVRLASEDEIPWDELAFPVIHRTLDLFFKDRKLDSYGSHMLDIEPMKKP